MQAKNEKANNRSCCAGYAQSIMRKVPHKVSMAVAIEKPHEQGIDIAMHLKPYEKSRCSNTPLRQEK